MYPIAFKVYANNYAAVEFTLTIEKVVVPATPVELGDNTVTVTDTWNGTAVEFTATEAGTYTFTAGTNAVLGYEGINYLPNEFFSVTLEANGVVSFVVLTEDYAEGDVVVTIAKSTDSDEGEGGDDPVVSGGSGTSEDPYVVTELPYSITKTGKHDFYITYTVTEDCTLQISYTSGCYVSDLPSNFEKNAAACTYTGTVTAGQVLKINPWNMSSSGEYTYTISKVEVVEPELPPENPDDGEDEEGGEGTTEIVYLSEQAANGRYLKYLVSDNTITIYRSESNGSFSETAVPAVYTITANGTESTAVKVSGNICTFEFGENSLPTTITWNGAAYTNFTLQA